MTDHLQLHIPSRVMLGASATMPRLVCNYLVLDMDYDYGYIIATDMSTYNVFDMFIENRLNHWTLFQLVRARCLDLWTQIFNDKRYDYQMTTYYNTVHGCTRERQLVKPDLSHRPFRPLVRTWRFITLPAYQDTLHT